MMGQQQLMLLVAAIVVVGFAAIYGIYNFTETSARTDINLLVHDGSNVSLDLEASEIKLPESEGPLGTDMSTDPASEDPKLVGEPHP